LESKELSVGAAPFSFFMPKRAWISMTAINPKRRFGNPVLRRVHRQIAMRYSLICVTNSAVARLYSVDWFYPAAFAANTADGGIC
jgi:hypothetical protein